MFPGLLQRCELSGSGSGESNEKPSNDDVEEVDPVAEPPVQKKPASKLKKGRAEVESEVTNLGGKSGKDDEDNGDGDDCGALGGSDKKKKKGKSESKKQKHEKKEKSTRKYKKRSGKQKGCDDGGSLSDESSDDSEGCPEVSHDDLMAAFERCEMAESKVGPQTKTFCHDHPV